MIQFNSFAQISASNGGRTSSISAGFEKNFGTYMKEVMRESARNTKRAKQGASEVMLTR